MRGIYWYDVSRSDKCRYNCHLHQRCAAVYESQNSRCSWVVLWWMFDHDWKQYVAAQIKKPNEKCLLILCYCHSLNLAVRDILKNIPLLNNTLDTCYEITDKKNNPIREAEFHRKQAEFLGQMECDFNVYDIDLPTLKIFAQQGGHSELHLWVLFWRAIEHWWSCRDGHKTMSMTLTWRQE